MMARAIVVGLVAGVPLAAQATKELAQQHACMACHDRDKAVVGPAFAAIAKRHAATPNAAAVLAKAIREGSKGVYGEMPMPAHPQLSADDAAALARWVLAGSP